MTIKAQTGEPGPVEAARAAWAAEHFPPVAVPEPGPTQQERALAMASALWEVEQAKARLLAARATPGADVEAAADAYAMASGLLDYTVGTWTERDL